MAINDLAAAWKDAPEDSRTWLLRLLRDEGKDLMEAEQDELRRGTPVYANAEASLGEVQRRMALNHIRMLPVLGEDSVIGILDLVDLATEDGLDPEISVGEILTA